MALADIEMSLEQILGWAFLIYGAAVAIWRVKRPEKLFKYAAFQKRWGELRGRWLHIAAYTVAPIVFGLILLWNK
ncbi:hypothetical protein NO1_1534 [Candidatus Termititenax aidoneus]|uniref:Uncharacterized protein n=1 Tax=Termititenax aidoneus TaxID=2218524 RepID=A0A388TCV9_TERA1|nr:hypothetical protein NO1_1534 [Candidatus Termititenax aidoneus]